MTDDDLKSHVDDILNALSRIKKKKYQEKNLKLNLKNSWNMVFRLIKQNKQL